MVGQKWMLKQLEKLGNVHTIYGWQTSNLTKLLAEVPTYKLSKNINIVLSASYIRIANPNYALALGGDEWQSKK